MLVEIPSASSASCKLFAGDSFGFDIFVNPSTRVSCESDESDGHERSCWPKRETKLRSSCERNDATNHTQQQRGRPGKNTSLLVTAVGNLFMYRLADKAKMIRVVA